MILLLILFFGYTGLYLWYRKDMKLYRRMTMENNQIVLCPKCAALMETAYILKKISKGVDAKVDCQNCRRHHYGGTYEIITKKSKRF